MKAVLLAGGLGTRMREETEFRPKPMVEVGGKPVLWHIMKILATQGITDFIVCAGYKSEFIKNYFYNYGSSNLDFTIRLGDQSSTIFHGSHDEFNWTVTVADTGPETNTGGRIKQIEKYLGHERFLVTYGDGIANVNISELINFHEKHERSATLTTTRAQSRFGLIDFDSNGQVTEFSEKPTLDSWINIGYFIFEPKVFTYLGENSVLENEPLRALAQNGELGAYMHDGFWQPMDTYREAQILNSLWNSGTPPWKIW
jgi:glucose-1-phosphate cytidylyltransferase